MLGNIINLHNSVFATIRNLTESWLLGLAMRLIFASVLMYFFLNSACTKVEGGCQMFSLGFADFPIPNSLIPSAGSYGQIVPPVAEAFNYDASAIPFFPWKIIVGLGTYMEFLLPVLLILGLFTRLTAVAFLGFIAIMTIVDINFHHVDAQTIGAFFDKTHNSALSDQRLLWIAPLITLIITGPGRVSLDFLLGLPFRER